MLLHCPTCRSSIEVALPPGSTAACPVCQGLFQVPYSVATPPTAPPAGAPAVPEAVAIIAGRLPDPTERDDEKGSLASTLAWAAIFFCAFAAIGGGSGYLVFRFVQSREALAPAANPATSVEVQTDPIAAWRQIGHWRGVGEQRTPAFRTTSPRWRLHWRAAPRDASNPDNFAVHVIDPGGKQLHTPVSIVGAGSDTAYVSTRPGRYLLEIFTLDTEWEVKVEEPE